MAPDDALERLGKYVAENRHGMVGDLVFALAWVTLVNAFFRLVDGPTWAYYLLMASGVIAYFGFVFSAQAALEGREESEEI